MNTTPTGPTPIRATTPRVDALLKGLPDEQAAQAAQQLDELAKTSGAPPFFVSQGGADPSLATRIELVEQRRSRDKQAVTADLAILGQMIQTDRLNIDRLYRIMNWMVAVLAAVVLFGIAVLAVVLHG